MKFDEYIDAYKGIKAPETLRERVNASAESVVSAEMALSAVQVRRARILSRALAAAAMFVILIAVVVIWKVVGNAPDPNTEYMGESIDTSILVPVTETSAIKLLEPDASSEDGIKFEMYAASAATVTVTSGTLTLARENDTPADTGASLTIPGGAELFTVYWKADFSKASEEDPFLLTLSDKNGTTVYALTYSEGELTLRKEKKTKINL